MRLAGWLRLAGLCVLASSISAPASLAQPRPTSGEPKKAFIQQDFKGYGPTLKSAKADALKNACDWLSNQSGLGWPSAGEEQQEKAADFLVDKGMVQFGEATEEDFEKSGHMQIVPMKLEITAERAKQIQKQAQQERMKDRQKYLLLGVIGVVCLLGVGGAYLRLEEATKGYYTRLLRLAAVGLIAVVVLGLLMVG